VKAIFRIAESNLDALSTVDLGPKRPFSVGECALWARSTGLQFAAQVSAVVSLVEAPASHRKATTVAKEIMAIKYGNATGHSINKLIETVQSIIITGSRQQAGRQEGLSRPRAFAAFLAAALAAVMHGYSAGVRRAPCYPCW
jgi:hypothetical protein